MGRLITDFFPKKRRLDSEKREEGKSEEEAVKERIDDSQAPGNARLVEHAEEKEQDGEFKRPEPKLESKLFSEADEAGYSEFCSKHNFNKQNWIASLTDEQRSLLALEIDTLHITWLAFLHGELTKPYFLKLKQFLQAQKEKTVFPPQQDIYSWSHLTPLTEVKCLIMGQDPYHNHMQAHGLAFSVLEPTRPPPSLVNIYKALQIDFPAFEIPDYKQLAKNGTPGGGNLTKWAKSGVLMLNACLTVEAHKPNSHAKKGWETFTEQVIKSAISYHQNSGFVIMAWGAPAQKRVAVFGHLLKDKFCVIQSVHPSPLSAHRGFFDTHVFRKCNDWLRSKQKEAIDWGIVPGNSVA